MIVAAGGMAINIVVAVMLSRAGGNINARGALIHVFGDLLGSVAALVAGAVIYWTGWTPIDPILSIVVALLILRSTLDAAAPVDRRADGARAGASLLRRDRRPRSPRCRACRASTTCTSGT